MFNVKIPLTGHRNSASQLGIGAIVNANASNKRGSHEIHHLSQKQKQLSMSNSSSTFIKRAGGFKMKISSNNQRE